jgi:hypothetical protein
VLDALAPRYSHAIPGVQAAQPEIDQGGLTNSCLTTDKDQLADILAGALKALVQCIHFCFATDDKSCG